MVAVAGFVEALCKALEAAGFAGEHRQFDEASGQLVLEGAITRVVPVAALCPGYTSCPDDSSRCEFINAVANAFAHGAADVPSNYSDCGARLLPQIWPIHKILARQATLPCDHKLPHCGLHGEQPSLLTSGSGMEVHTVGVVLVCDYMADSSKPLLAPIETPVLSSDLARWGVSFVDALQKALENLRVRTRVGPAVDKRWEYHDSGCARSAQCDRFDAARCALFPTLVVKRKRSDGVPEPGGHIVAFASTSCVLAATSKNALGLCYMGDTLHLKMGNDDENTKAQNLLSTTPYRLLKMKDPFAAATSSKSDPPPMRHPLNQIASEGFVWRWRAYKAGGPPLCAQGEFSVPITQEEVDGILGAIQSGGPMPVFSHPDPEEVAKPSQFAKLKEQANAVFKAGDYVKAIVAYDAALSSKPAPSDSDAAIAHANAAQAMLNLAGVEVDNDRKQGCAAEAMRRAMLASQLDPTFGKAHARLAAACEILGEHAAATEARGKAEACANAKAIADTAANAAKQSEAEKEREELKARKEKMEQARQVREHRDALLEREKAYEDEKELGALSKEAATAAKLSVALGIDVISSHPEPGLQKSQFKPSVGLDTKEIFGGS